MFLLDFIHQTAPYYFSWELLTLLVILLVTIYLISDCSIHNIFLVLSFVAVVSSLPYSQPASAGGAHLKHLKATVEHLELVRNSLIYGEFSKTVTTFVQTNPHRLTTHHPTSFMEASRFIPLEEGETLVINWTNNVSSPLVKKLLKKHPGSLVTSSIDAPQSLDFNVVRYENYDPNVVWDNFCNNIRPTPGAILHSIFDSSDTIKNGGVGPKLPLTASDMFFHLDRHQHILWEKTESFDELSFFVHNGPNAFKYLDPNGVIHQEFLSANNFTFLKYCKLIENGCLGPDDLSCILPSHVVEKSNLLLGTSKIS